MGEYVEDHDLIERARTSDESAVVELFRRHQPRLSLMVRLRMSPRLRQRIDEEDVLQDAFLEASKRLPAYLQDPRAPFFLWLRQIVNQSLLKSCRQHLGLQLRDAHREVSLTPLGAPSSLCLAKHLIGGLTSPSRAAMRDETQRKMEEALGGMTETDREILSLRHFEQLSNHEAAFELGIETSAASKRYVRALLRLEKILAEMGIRQSTSTGG